MDKQFKMNGPKRSLDLSMSMLYAVTGWAVSVLPEVCVNIASELMGTHILMIERVVERLRIPPCLNDQVSGYDMTNIIDTFWHEFKHWQNMTGSYAVCKGMTDNG